MPRDYPRREETTHMAFPSRLSVSMDCLPNSYLDPARDFTLYHVQSPERTPSRRSATKRTASPLMTGDHLTTVRMASAFPEPMKPSGWASYGLHATRDDARRSKNSRRQESMPKVPREPEPIRKLVAPWIEEHERSSLPTPPRTPEIPRLGTPDLEPLSCAGRFCDCCKEDEGYLDGRSKMDSQLQAALAHIARSSTSKRSDRLLEWGE